MEKDKSLAKAMEYCARSERSRKEVVSFLESIGAKEQDINDVISHLIKENFIDDLRYAEAYVSDKYRFNKWGKKKISYQLVARGIPGDIIDQALATLDPDEYYQGLKDEIEKKLRTLKGGSYYDKKSKLLRFAAGRGYETDLIYEVVEELLHK
jgi:regulatory protein